MIRAWPFRTKQLIVLSGDVLSVRVIITRGEYDFEGEYDSEFRSLWRFVNNESQTLRAKIAAAAQEHLGAEFEVRSVTFGKGSIEMLVIIGTAYYYAISRYKNFIESIELFVSQLKQIVTRFSKRADLKAESLSITSSEKISVSTSWSPGPALVRAEMTGADKRSSGYSLLLMYFIVSHATLLGLLCWLVVTHTLEIGCIGR